MFKLRRRIENVASHSVARQHQYSDQRSQAGQRVSVSTILEYHTPLDGRQYGWLKI